MYGSGFSRLIQIMSPGIGIIDDKVFSLVIPEEKNVGVIYNVSCKYFLLFILGFVPIRFAHHSFRSSQYLLTFTWILLSLCILQNIIRVDHLPFYSSFVLRLAVHVSCCVSATQLRAVCHCYSTPHYAIDLSLVTSSVPSLIHSGNVQYLISWTWVNIPTRLGAHAVIGAWEILPHTPLRTLFYQCIY